MWGYVEVTFVFISTLTLVSMLMFIFVFILLKDPCPICSPGIFLKSQMNLMVHIPYSYVNGIHSHKLTWNLTRGPLKRTAVFIWGSVLRLILKVDAGSCQADEIRRTLQASSSAGALAACQRGRTAQRILNRYTRSSICIYGYIDKHTHTHRIRVCIYTCICMYVKKYVYVILPLQLKFKRAEIHDLTNISGLSEALTSACCVAVSTAPERLVGMFGPLLPVLQGLA